MILGGRADWWADIKLWLAGWRRLLLTSLAGSESLSKTKVRMRARRKDTAETTKDAMVIAVKMQIGAGWYHCFCL